jgi:hypothetical protein
MEEKYMRAANAAWEYIYGEHGIGGVKKLAEAIKAEIERPEPLVTGVRYRNTEANRNRIACDKEYREFSIPVIVYKEVDDVVKGETFLAPEIAYWNNEDNSWVGLSYNNSGDEINDIAAFALIPDGEVQDE